MLDFVRWRHAGRGHPKVGSSMKAATGDVLVEYYLHDPMYVISDTIDSGKDADDALTAYLKVKDDKEKVWNLLVLLDIDPRTFSGNKADDQRMIELRRIATEKPKKFNEIYADRMFEQKYKLQGMINAGIVLQDRCTVHLWRDQQDHRQYRRGGIVLLFTDPSRTSDIIVMMMAQLQEANKQVIRKKTSKTRTPVGRN